MRPQMLNQMSKLESTMSRMNCVFLDISKNSNLKENPEKLKQNSERTQKPATRLFYCKSSFTIFFLL